MSNNTVIIDYGLGNLRSVLGALQHVGAKASISADATQILEAEHLILPGVGAFGDGMKNLHERGLVNILNKAVLENKKSLLGICLGAQLVCKESFEFGNHQGLGWLDASVVRFDPSDKTLRIPHVGWNELKAVKECPLLEGIPVDALFYYVHSFRIKQNSEDIVVGTCDYGEVFPSVVNRENIYATQFHPEKSQVHGLRLLNNFLSIC